MSKKLDELTQRITDAGAKNAKSWASSEIAENIPQFARFLVLKNLTNIHNDIGGNLCAASDFDAIEDEYQNIAKQIGGERLEQFLHCYGKGVINQVIELLDDGNPEIESDKVGWVLMETNEQQITSDRLIQGLHEDFLEFELDELRKHSVGSAVSL